MPTRGKVKIALVQYAVGDDLKANLDKALALTRAAAKRGADIVAHQELFRTKYFPQAEHTDASGFAESIPGESTQAFAALAKELGIVVVVPLYERAQGGKLFNSAVVIDADGKFLPTYRKVHIPHDPLFWEKNYFENGDKGFLVHKTKFGSIAVLICFDQWFPEAARANALKGAELIFYPTAIGNIVGHDAHEGDWRDAWTTIQRAHAIANGVHVAAINRVGIEGKLAFWGSSFVADSFGNLLAKAGEKEEVLICEVDLAQNKRVQGEWGFRRNRRPDAYGALTESVKEMAKP